MSTNKKFGAGRVLALAASHPASPATSLPCRVGALVGVADVSV